MITIYGMKTCPACQEVEAKIGEDPNYHFIDIGDHVKNMKAFIQIRDKNPAFADVIGSGSIGIPCFVLEDGRVTLDPAEAGL